MDGRDAMIAVAMNGEPLPARHGYPARLVVPGLYGYVSATKWVTDIRLTGWDDFDAYWIPRGWAKRGPVKTMARIDTPRGGRRQGPEVAIGRPRVGCPPRHLRGAGAHRRRRVAHRRDRRGAVQRHLGPVGVPLDRRHTWTPRGRSPRRRRRRRRSSPRGLRRWRPTVPRGTTG